MKEIKPGYIIAVGHHFGTIKSISDSVIEVEYKERQCMCKTRPSTQAQLISKRWYWIMKNGEEKIANIYQTRNHMKHFPNACDINDPQAALYKPNYKGTSFDT